MKKKVGAIVVFYIMVFATMAFYNVINGVSKNITAAMLVALIPTIAFVSALVMEFFLGKAALAFETAGLVVFYFGCSLVLAYAGTSDFFYKSALFTFALTLGVSVHLIGVLSAGSSDSDELDEYKERKRRKKLGRRLTETTKIEANQQVNRDKIADVTLK